MYLLQEVSIEFLQLLCGRLAWDFDDVLLRLRLIHWDL